MRWGLKSKAMSVRDKRRKTKTEKKDHVQMGVEILVLLPAKEYLQPQKLAEARQNFLRAFRGSMALPTPSFTILISKTCARINFCC